jgi:hypothetical protein
MEEAGPNQAGQEQGQGQGHQLAAGAGAGGAGTGAAATAAAIPVQHIPCCVVDNHCDVVPFLQAAWRARALPFGGIHLLHFDVSKQARVQATRPRGPCACALK